MILVNANGLRPPEQKDAGFSKDGFSGFLRWQKRATPHAGAARDLYISNWFVKARDYVESTRCSWFIFSAKYGMSVTYSADTPL